MKKLILLIALSVAAAAAAQAQAENKKLEFKYSLKTGSIANVEVGCNQSPSDEKVCLSYTVSVTVDGVTKEVEVDRVEKKKLINALNKAINPVGSDLTAFCLKVEGEYEKFRYGQVKYNFNIYSDLYGLSANQPNGLIQPHLEVSFPLITNLYKNLSKDADARIYFFRNIMTQITYSKPDNHLKDLPTFKADTVRSTRTYGVLQSRANLADILQYSFLNFGVKLNLATVVLRSQRLYIDAITNRYFTSVYDSLHAQRISVPSYTFGMGAKYATNFPSRFNFQIYYSVQLFRAATNDLAISNGLQFQDKSLIMESLKKNAYAPSINSDASGWFQIFGSQISLRNADNNKGEKFLKFSYFENGANFFFQIQVGYSANLDDFVNSITKGKDK